MSASFLAMKELIVARMKQSGSNSIGSNLNARSATRRANYMDVICNPGDCHVASVPSNDKRKDTVIASDSTAI